MFSPLLCEMEEIGTTLDRDEFMDASLRLFQTLTVSQKNQILQFKRVPRTKVDVDARNCTFQPEINTKSAKLAIRNISKQINMSNSEIHD